MNRTVETPEPIVTYRIPSAAPGDIYSFAGHRLSTMAVTVKRQGEVITVATPDGEIRLHPDTAEHVAQAIAQAILDYPHPAPLLRVALEDAASE